MDGVQSCVTGTKIARGGGNFYYQYESESWFLTGAMRSWSWHQNCKRRREYLVSGISLIWCRKRSWSQHQNCKRIGVVQLLVMSIKPIYRYSSTWCCRDNPGHSTKIARGLDWYKGWKRYFLLAWIYIYILSLHWCCKRSWSWHQNCKRIY